MNTDELDDKAQNMRVLIDAAGPLPPLTAEGCMCVLYAGIGVGEAMANMVKSLHPEDSSLYMTAIAGTIRDELAHGWKGEEATREAYVEMLAYMFSETMTKMPLADDAIRAARLTRPN